MLKKCNLEEQFKNENLTNESIKYAYSNLKKESFEEQIEAIDMILKHKDISSELLNILIIDIASTNGNDEDAINKIKEILNNEKYEVDKETVKHIRHLKKYNILIEVLNKNKEVYTKDEYIELFKELELIDTSYIMKLGAYIASNLGLKF